MNRQIRKGVVVVKKWFIMALCALLLLTSAVAVGAVPDEETTETTEAAGDIFISMELTPQDSGLKVQLLDNRGGVVSMWPVSLTIDGQVAEQLITDMTGVAVFASTIPADATDVVVKAVDGEYAGTVFVGCSMKVTPTGETAAPEPTTTTTAPDQTDTQTTAPTTEGETTVTEPETTQTTAVDVVGDAASKLSVAPTTMKEDGNRVGVGVDVDAALVGVSQTTGAEWNSKSLLWMDKAHYASLVSELQATLHLQLNYNAAAATQDIIVAAKNADENFASYGNDEVKGFAMDLHMIYIDGDNRVELEPTDSMYTIEMPVPAALANCEKIAIGVCTTSGIDSYLQIKPVDGMLKFSIKRFQTLAVVGFGNGGAVNSVMQTPALLIVFGGIGLVLVAAGIFLIVFFALRRRKATIDSEQDNDAKDVTRKVMLAPTSEVVVGTGDGSDKEAVDPPVLLEHDEQSDLTREERERFRAKEGDPEAIAQLESESVSPAHQIDPKQVNAPIPDEPQGVDELLSELDELLEDLGNDID